MSQLPVALMNEAIARASTYSPYLRGLLERYPDVADPLDQTLAQPEPISVCLRHEKARLALSLALGDLAGTLSLAEVTAGLSDFADHALNLAIADAISAHVPGAQVEGFTAIALGKHGGRELNYSSDIDPIFLFDPATLPHRPREDVGEAAVRIGRRVVETMQARTEHGYVFRVDLRLRPSPEVTPIVLPVEAAISYYESSALPWERAAFIRARSAAGDVALGQSFLDAIRPFVWRRGLDFGSVSEMRTMTRRIRDHHARGQKFGPGYDLKRGRGGIREVEFFTQIQQLIHGGRDPSLRSANTLDALEALVTAGHVSARDRDILAPAYRLFRTIEHRLQMIDDRQTHSLPVESGALDSVARLHGLDDGSALLSLLAPHVESVGTLYDALDGDAEQGDLPTDLERLTRELDRTDFGEAAFLAERIAHWRSGTLRPLRSDAALRAFEGVLPRLAHGLGSAREPRTAIVRFETMLERLPSAINLFRLLEARPQLLSLLIDVLCLAPVLADALSRRVGLLDGLIDASALDLPGSVDVIASRLLDPDRAAPLEMRLDRVRLEVGELRFALGVQLVTGGSDPLDVARGYARVAEAAISTVADAVISEFVQQHGRVPDSEFVILALGRLGGGELTHASDLDLIYLFTGDFARESDGAKPLGASHYYGRLAQRITNGLSVPTAAGPLYEVDTRLRPSGADGPLVVSLDSFARYQREAAWSWEHLALTRARPVYGSEAARREAASIIAATLDRERDSALLIADAAQMRRDIAKHKPPAGPLDIKLGGGGLVDLEFCVATSQLLHRAGFSPDLSVSIAALEARGCFKELGSAHALLTRLLVTLRLVAEDGQIPDAATKSLVATVCRARDWDDLMVQCATAQDLIARTWAEMTKGA